jgi:hypothetical protein
MNPNYLKPGMSMAEVKKLLNNDNFSVLHYQLENSAVHSSGQFCDRGRLCELGGNHALRVIYFANRKTGVVIATYNYNDKLYDVQLVPRSEVQDYAF